MLDNSGNSGNYTSFNTSQSGNTHILDFTALLITGFY